MNRPSPDMSTGQISPWLAFAVLLGGAAINVMDITLVIVALPSIQADLAADPGRIGWVPAAYATTFALGLLTFGRIGDLKGRKMVFLIGLAAFAAASLLCAAAADFSWLITARAIQGIAGAALVPQVLAMIPVLFGPSDRPRAFALFALIGSFAAACGPLLGGLLVTVDPFGLGWRTIFLTDAICAIAFLAAAARLVPKVPGQPGKPVDGLGALLFGSMTLCLILPLFEGQRLGWPQWTIAMMVLAVPFGFAFILWQRHQSRNDAPQMLPYDLLSQPQFVAALGLVVLLFSGPPGLLLVLSVMLQTAFDLSPALAGLTLAPFPLGVMSGSLFGSRFLPSDTGIRIAIGAAILALNLVLLLLVLPTIDEMVFWLMPPLFLGGLGMGMAAPALFQRVMAGVPPSSAGVASGAAQTLQQLGAAAGIAVCGGIFAAVLAGNPQTGHAVAAAAATGFPAGVVTLVAVFTGFSALRTRPGV